MYNFFSSPKTSRTFCMFWVSNTCIVEPLKGKLLCETTGVLCPLFGRVKLWVKTVKISILLPEMLVNCSHKFLALRFRYPAPICDRLKVVPWCVAGEVLPGYTGAWVWPAGWRGRHPTCLHQWGPGGHVPPPVSVSEVSLHPEGADSFAFSVGSMRQSFLWAICVRCFVSIRKSLHTKSVHVCFMSVVDTI